MLNILSSMSDNVPISSWLTIIMIQISMKLINMLISISELQWGFFILHVSWKGMSQQWLIFYSRSMLRVCPRRIYRGAVNLFLFRHCPSKIFWKCIIWNINIQYKNGWYTLQKWTKPVFAFRHWENIVSSSIYPSWLVPHYQC